MGGSCHAVFRINSSHSEASSRALLCAWRGSSLGDEALEKCRTEQDVTHCEVFRFHHSLAPRHVVWPLAWNLKVSSGEEYFSTPFPRQLGGYFVFVGFPEKEIRSSIAHARKVSIRGEAKCQHEFESKCVFFIVRSLAVLRRALGFPRRVLSLCVFSVFFTVLRG